MKRFTSFLITLFLAISAMAQSETKNVTVTPSGGSFKNGGDVVTSGWASSWTSSTEPIVTISVGGVNNMNAATTSGFQMARGSNADSDWTFSIADYKVTAYSFKFKSAIQNQNVTLTATNADGTEVSMTSSYSTEQTFSIDCSNAATATFRISGSNYSIIATELTLTYREPLALTSLEVGQVYHFENVLYPGFSLNANSATDVDAVTTNKTDTKQQWYVEMQDGEYYVLRNLAYGKYLKGDGQSSDWSMSDDYSHDYNKFKLFPSNADYNTLHTNTLKNYAYIHCNSSKNIVGWSNSVTDQGSHWTITQVDYTDAQIKELLEKAPTVAEVAAYPAALGAIFSDAACTILNSAYTKTSMTDEQLAADANYSALPQTLKDMVKKVRNDEWSEATIAPASRPNGNNNDNHNLWTVEDTWNDAYARKFRVQMYEPYSVEGEITSFLGINAHCNMDNPTGIYANAGESIYIMVEGDIAPGAELWVAHQTGHGVTYYYNNAAYTQLKKGLNVIPYASDGCQLWINYLVHTYNTSTGEFSYKLRDYKPLKIHIEGGHINGFFNAMGDFRSTEVTGEANGGENLWGEVDNDADWDYYKARAALATDFALLGHRQTLLFPFGTWDSTNGYFGVANDGGGIEKALAWHLENIEVPTTPNCYAGSENAFDTYYPGMNLDAETGKINIMLEAWDRIMYSEHATMGLLSKSNIDKMNSLYPGWTAENTTFDIYNYGSNDIGDTYKAFCGGRDYSDYYNHHGAAVGSGSGYMSGGWRVCNYHYNTMGSIIGQIAVEAGPTWGPAHEIGHQHQAIFNLNGQTEVTNNLFSNVAVWYMGMGTSRVNGTEGSLASVLDAFNTEDNDLYTNNIWAITHLYYRLWLYYHLAGNNTQFWPRLFELLRQTPMVNGGQISGETSLLRFYQHACDAAGEDLTEFFRAHGFFELMTNRLVGDYSNATYNVTEEQIETAITAVKENNYPENYAVLLINDATSETTLTHDGTTKRALWDTDASAEYGSVNDFIEGSATTGGAYTATVNSDGTMTMTGEGGVGFLVFNENRELVSFSNKSTFELSDEAKHAIISGDATIVSVGSDINSAPVTATVDLTAIKKGILGELIAKAQKINDKIDNTYTKVGHFKAAAVADLASALEAAIEVYNNGTGYEGAYEILYSEYTKVIENPDSRVTIDTNLAYTINSYAYATRNMTVNDSKQLATVENASGTAAEWYFVKSPTAGKYYLKNGNGEYCPAVVTNGGKKVVVDSEAEADLYSLHEIEYGVWAICGSKSNMHSSASEDYAVVGWTYDGAPASWWYVTTTTANETIEDLTELQVLISKTERLINEVSAGTTVTKGTAYELQTTASGSPYYLWSNAPEDSEGSINYLVDGITGSGNNYFHTEWSSEPASGSHYIAVDLGAGTTIDRFTISHTTRYGANSDFPKSADIYGSNDNTNYHYIGSTDRMSQSGDAYWEYSGAIVSVPYRYLRFNMHADRGYWHLAEFDLYPITDISATVKDVYSTGDKVITAATLTTALNEMLEAKALVNSNAPSKNDITAEIEALKKTYQALLTEYNAILKDKLSSLNTITTATNELIDEVGDITGNPFSGYVALQSTNSSGLYYISTNADQNTGGGKKDGDGIAALVDNKEDTYFHSRWGGDAVNAPHHIQIDLGDGNSINSFKFKYVAHNAPDPTKIVVWGSNDEESFTEIETITKDVTAVSSTYTSKVFESATAYRYLRFAITESSRDGYNSEFGSYYCFGMKEFDLYLYSNLTFAVYDSYSETVSEELYASTHYTTEASDNMYETGTSSIESGSPLVTIELLDAQIADQQAAYDKLNEAMQKVTCDKTALNELIEATRILKNGLYETVITSYTANEITLSATEGDAGWLYCNAAESNSTSETDNAGVAAAIDLTAGGEPNLETFLHTEYGNDQSADGLDHYLRVDLGTDGATDYVEFGYYGRSGHLAKSPEKVIVAATNDLTDGGVWTEIATLNLARASASTETKTGCLGNGVEYRYWRFLVEETHGGGTDGNNHQFFCMTEFNVYKCTGIVKDEQLKYSPTIYIYTTTELVTEVENGITQAQGVVDNADATQGDVDAEVDALQAVYDKLEEALKYAGLPVTITTDEANPVLYKIISKRGDNDERKMLQFDEPASDKVALVATADNASYQAWYFMKGDNGYLIKPFNGDGKMLGVSSTGDAQASASIAETPTYKEWDFSRSTVTGCTDYFYIYVNGTSHACLSHNGGFYATDKLGIWAGGWNTNDGGTLFKFVEAEFDNDNARYYQLSDFENTLEYQTATTPEGTTVGAFVNGDAYSTAYTTASTLIEAGNTSDAAACKDAYTALRTASVGVEKIVPEEGKIYRIYITPGYTASDRAGASMRIDDNGKLYCDTYAESNARFYFTFEYDDDGNLYMKNLHSATYLDEALNSTNNNNVQVGADAEDIANAKKIAINTLGKSGDAVVVGIVPDGGDMLKCAGKPGNVVAYDNEAVDKASAWVIEEVEPTTLEEKVKHTISLAPNTTGDDQTTGYSTLNLGYPVTVPAGVKAYIVTNSAIVDNTIELYEYASEGATIPANFPVILRGSTETAATREFQFKNSSVAAVDNVTNLLGGTNYTTYESCLNENGENVYNIYMLTRSGGIVAMRWAYENYDANFNYTGKNDDGGYVKCTANKVYLKLGGTSSANLSATYYFSLFSGTTDIDKIESEENPLDGTIYDLQGRKIDEVKTPGFYIVNGKKMYVNSEMLK